MSRTAHLLEIVGGIVATLGGTALIGYWLFTLGQPAASLNSPPTWTSLAITASGLAAMAVGSLLPKTPKPSASANSTGGRGGDALVVGGAGEAIGGDAGIGGAAFGPGGDGGSATAINTTGRAVGGRGGRGGSGGATGGRGGDAALADHRATGGTSVGGGGGDAGRSGRPALGAPSALSEHGPEWALSLPDMRDRYGIPLPGRGGDSYHADINWDGRTYSLNVLLRLLDMEHPRLLDEVDAAAAETGVDAPQDWWTLAFQMFPRETSAAMLHMRNCEDGWGRSSDSLGQGPN